MKKENLVKTALIVELLNINSFFYKLFATLLFVGSQIRFRLSYVDFSLLLIGFSYIVTKKIIVNDYELSGLLSEFALILFLVFVRIENSLDIANLFEKIAVLSVPISIVLSALYLGGYYDSHHTSEKIFFIERLYFLFNEPSHYGIFLSMTLIYSMMLGRHVASFVIALGLILTSSILSFFLFIFLYLFWIMRFNVKAFIIIIVFCLLVSFMIFNVDFLNSKFSSLLATFTEEAALSSSFVRIESFFMGKELLKQIFYDAEFYNFFWGAESPEAWVNEYYLKKYGFEPAVSSSFNFFTSILLHTGFLGFTIFLIIFLRKIKYFSKKIVLSIATFFILSFTHGYAFGPLALLFLYQFFLLINLKDSEHVSELNYRRNFA